MDPIESANLRETYRLNQRGGRLLSIVDLMEAGTIDAEQAALCWLLIESGASFLTGAVPGGAGKTTLMAGLLAFLPPGERIVTTGEPETLELAVTGRYPTPFCLLSHEIGQGTWYGYIWGSEAQAFFSLRGAGRRCVSCLHADTPGQCRAILSDCGVAARDIDRIGMMLFMRVQGAFLPLRRVSALYCRLGSELRQVYRWRRRDDTFEALIDRRDVCGSVAHSIGAARTEALSRWDRCAAFLTGLQREGVRDFGMVRARIAAAYGREGP